MDHAPPTDHDTTSAGGWLCPDCNTWIASGWVHICPRLLASERAPVPTYSPAPPDYSAQLGRIIELLDRLIELAGG